MHAMHGARCMPIVASHCGAVVVVAHVFLDSEAIQCPKDTYVPIYLGTSKSDTIYC